MSVSSPSIARPGRFGLVTALTMILAACATTRSPDAPDPAVWPRIPETAHAGRGAPTAVITRDDIASRPASRMTDVLSRVPGLKLVSIGGTGWGVASARHPRPAPFALSGVPRSRAPQPSACYLQLHIDGARTTGFGEVEAFDINQIRVESVERIEIYLNASALPAGFGGRGAACGVIVIQTRVR